jgi:mxaJ protein
MTSTSRFRSVVLAVCASLVLCPEWAAAEGADLRVCADPNNLPFSNTAGEGFENKIADLVAKDLGRKVAYTWWAQRRGWFRNTLKAQTCDVVMGVPAALDMVLSTRPYYRSTYVFVYRAKPDLHLASITDPRLRTLKIGVQLIGDDGYNTPPVHVLGEEGIVTNVVGYPVYGDYRDPNPPERVIKAVEDGAIDVAAVWGPLGGYAALHAAVPLVVAPIRDAEKFAPFAFQYDIAMGVRKNDRALKAQLDEVIARRGPEIHAILVSYGVPTVEP